VSWPLVSLDSLAQKIDYGLTASAAESIEGPRFLRITDLQNDTVDWKSVPSCVCTKKDVEQYRLVKGDIVFARTGATTGKSYLLNEMPEDTVFASYLIRVRPNEKVDSQYLSFFFKSPIYWQQIAVMANGAAQPGVNSSKLKELEVPLPPLADQKRIAAILDKADSLRRKNQQAIQLGEKFLRAMFLDMFGDPVSNPKGWETKKLKELTSKIGSGATPRGGQSAYVETGISLIRSLNIHDDKFLHKDLAFITNEQAAALSNVEVEKNDVLLNITGASVCRCAMVDNSILPARVNQHVCIIRAPEMEPEYLLHLIISRSFKKNLLKIAGGAGATREALTKEQVENLLIPIPPHKLQEKFSAIKERIRLVIETNNTATGLSLFESLSQKAFTGRL